MVAAVVRVAKAKGGKRGALTAPRASSTACSVRPCSGAGPNALSLRSGITRGMQEKVVGS